VVEETTTGSVIVTDTLPPEVLFNEASDRNDQKWNVIDISTIEVDLGVLNPGEYMLTFGAFIAEDAFTTIDELEFTNNVSVVTLAATPTGADYQSTCDVTHAIPEPTPTPSPTPSVSPSPTPTPTPTPTPSVTPSPTPTPTPTPSATPSPSPTPIVYTCQSPCETDAQCQTGNASHFCSSDYGNTCRLYTNPSSDTCEPQVETYACNSTCSTNEQCYTANPNYICNDSACRLAENTPAVNCLPLAYVPPAPSVGCNEVCATNSDCSQVDHLCYTTSTGENRCRNQDYVNSDTCSAPPATQTIYTTVAQVQPELPAELPQTGILDVANWLKAGLVTIGLGAALLLLL